MHEFVNEHLGLFTILELIEALAVDLNDVGHGETGDLMEDLAEAPYAGNSSSLRIDTAYAIDTVFEHVIELDPLHESIDPLLDIWSDEVPHEEQHHSTEGCAMQHTVWISL